MSENLYAPVQIVVDTEKLLDRIGWRDVEYSYDGEPEEVGGTVDLRRDLAGEVARQLAARLEDEMRSVVRDTVKEVAGQKVSEIVDDVVNGEVSRTNQWGEKVGEPITLRALLVDQVKEQLTRKVNYRGEPVSGYDRDGRTYLAWVAGNAAQEALRGELADATKAAVDEVKAKVTGLVAEQLGAQIAKAVTR